MSFLTRRPIAHRGLHDKSKGILENCPKAFSAAISHNYAIECDVQLSADGEAMVFHDFTLDRLTHETGDLSRKTTDELRKIAFKETDDKMISLRELCALTQGKVPLVIEIKSPFKGDFTLTEQTLRVMKDYKGEFALMSFDPAIIAFIKANAPQVMRGIVSESRYNSGEWLLLPPHLLQSMRELSHFKDTDPHFLSWSVRDLPIASTTLFREALKRPVICWTVKTEEQRTKAAKFADQVTFEGYLA